MDSVGTAISSAIVGGDVLARTSLAAHDPRVPSGYRRVYAAKTATNSLADWGVFILAAGLADKVLSKTIDNFGPTRRFRENHPVVTYLGSFAAVVLAAQYVANKTSIFVSNVLNRGGVDEFLHERLNRPGANRFIESVRPSMEKIAKVLSKPRVIFWGNLGLIGLITGLLAYASGRISSAKQQNDMLEHMVTTYPDFQSPFVDEYPLSNTAHTHKFSPNRNLDDYTSRRDLYANSSRFSDLKEKLGLRPGDRVIVIDKSTDD